MKKHLIYWLAAIALFAISCQKELSFEQGNSPAKGSLQSDITGDCLPKTVNGTFLAGTTLVPATNTITVQVNVTKTGTYTVYTDTINGYHFRATGTFTNLGANNVTLRGNGIPVQPGVNNFVVNFDTTFCDIQVTVTSPGIGNLAGSPNACTPISVNGGYSPGVALTSGNNAVVTVNVTTAGLINITTDTIAGIWFNFSGSLPQANGQSVTLQARGGPITAGTSGPQTFTVKLGASRCTFVVPVAAPAGGTLGGGPGACTPSQVFGTYAVGVPVNAAAADSVHIEVSFTQAGAYNITANATPSQGFSFAASGIAAVGNNQTITLIGSGTPTTAGPQTFTVTFGTSTCTFVVNVGAAANTDHFPLTANSWWSYDDIDGIFVFGDSLTRLNINPITLSGNVYRIFQNQDDTTPFDSSYYRRISNDYVERNDVDYYTAIFTFDVAQKGDILFLKEGLTTNQAWESAVFNGTFSAVPASLKYTFTCTDANGTATINGNNFTNVYKIAWRPKINIAGTGYQDEFVSFESWYARGVGLIYFKINDLTGGPSSDINIQHWQVF